MAISQRPLTLSGLNKKAPASEGWKSIPSWYVMGDVDRVIPPAAELFMAQRAKSRFSHVSGAGHASMISHPQATVSAIFEAARSITQ